MDTSGERLSVSTIVYALFHWRGRLARIPYIVGALTLFVLTGLYSCAVYAGYLSYTGVSPITWEALKNAQQSGLLPPVVLLPMTILLFLLDAKRLRSLNMHPAIALVNAGSLLPQLTGTSAGQFIALALYIYRISLCLLPPRVSPPHVMARNRSGSRGVRIYHWRVRETPRPGEKTL